MLLRNQANGDQFLIQFQLFHRPDRYQVQYLFKKRDQEVILEREMAVPQSEIEALADWFALLAEERPPDLLLPRMELQFLRAGAASERCHYQIRWRQPRQKGESPHVILDCQVGRSGADNGTTLLEEMHTCRLRKDQLFR